MPRPCSIRAAARGHSPAAPGRPLAPDLTGRVSTAINTVALGLAFAVQAAVGWILDLCPRTVSGGWDPDGYSWALGMTAALQAVAALVMVTALHRRP